MTMQKLLREQQQLIEQVECSLIEVQAGGNSKGILVTGPSGTGKTTAMDLVADLLPPDMDGVQRRVPCCRVVATSKSETKSVARSILHQLGKPMSATKSSRADELELDAMKALIACDVRILTLEEFNNALLQTKELRGQLSKFLRNLWNLHPADDPGSWALPCAGRRDKRLVIIVSGTEELRQVFDTDQELSSRFSCRINTVPLWFDSKESRGEFRTVFETLVRRFNLQDAISCSDANILSRSMFACSSHLRRLESLLNRAATLRATGRSSAEGSELLSKAFKAVLQAGASHPNPFRWPDDDLKRRVAAEMKRPKHA